MAGGFIDQALLGPLAASSGETRIAEGPRLFDLKLGASSEGAPIPRVYGRARLPGQLIWATRFKEEVIVTTPPQLSPTTSILSAAGSLERSAGPAPTSGSGGTA